MKSKILIIIIFLLFPLLAFGLTAGNRGSFTRLGYVGARYEATGRSLTVMADDVYALYWNPAGLIHIKTEKKLTAQEIKNRAKKGDLNSIQEKDLLEFSESSENESAYQIGFSGGVLDLNRYSAFTGFAFTLGKGVAAIGVNSVFSLGINRYNDAGVFLGNDINYISGAFYFGYGWFIKDIAALGFSGKILYEQIDDKIFMGAAIDAGTQIVLLPFLKVGVVAQNIGIGLAPLSSSYSGIDYTYSFGLPSLKFSLMLVNSDKNSFTVTIEKNLDEEDFAYSFGIQFYIIKEIAIYLGFNKTNFTTGISFVFYKVRLSYSLAFDPIDYGFNHAFSLSAMF